jgi:transposase
MNSGQPKYDESFKKSIISLYQNGKTQTQLGKEYGISTSAISRWIKLYSEVKLDDETTITAKQVEDLQKRNAELEEEVLILKKALAIFMQRSENA